MLCLQDHRPQKLLISQDEITYYMENALSMLHFCVNSDVCGITCTTNKSTVFNTSFSLSLGDALFDSLLSVNIIRLNMMIFLQCYMVTNQGNSGLSKCTFYKEIICTSKVSACLRQQLKIGYLVFNMSMLFE